MILISLISVEQFLNQVWPILIRCHEMAKNSFVKNNFVDNCKVDTYFKTLNAYVFCFDTQVREQQRDIALQIRREVERRRQRELEKLEEELRVDWERQQREKLNALQKLYEESLQLLGQGHRSAKENVR